MTERQPTPGMHENFADRVSPTQPPGSHVSGETYAEKHGELRRLRAVRGLSTRAMAAEIGISAATLNRAENGETVSVDVAAKLGPYIGECLCCGQPVWAPPQSREGTALQRIRDRLDGKWHDPYGDLESDIKSVLREMDGGEDD